MRRYKQQVTDGEALEILQSAKRGVLAVMGDEGYPYTIPLDFVYDDGKIYFHSAKTGHKIDAIRNYDKASFCVLNDGYKELGQWWYHITSIICFGRICLVEDESIAMEKLRRIGKKYFPSEVDLEEEMAKNAKNAAVIELTIEHMTGKKVREK